MASEDVDKLITFGQMALEQGWCDKAREYFQQALELAPSNREAMKGLARANEILSRKAAAAVEPARVEPVKPPRKVSVEPTKPEVEPAEPRVEREQQASFELQMSVPTVESRREQSRGVRYWAVRIVLAAVAFGILIGLMTIWWTVSTPLGSSTATRGSGGRIGEKTTVYSDSGTTVLAAVDLDTVDEIRKANRANDTIGLMALVLDGKVLNVLNNTEVLVLDKQSGVPQVRILEGTYIYRTAWVPSNCVK